MNHLCLILGVRPWTTRKKLLHVPISYTEVIHVRPIPLYGYFLPAMEVITPGQVNSCEHADRFKFIFSTTLKIKRFSVKGPIGLFI